MEEFPYTFIGLVVGDVSDEDDAAVKVGIKVEDFVADDDFFQEPTSSSLTNVRTSRKRPVYSIGCLLELKANLLPSWCNPVSSYSAVD
jgi:hypothetical protein